MGWIGSPEEQRKFDEDVDRRITISMKKEKFGKYFICKYCIGEIIYRQREWENGKIWKWKEYCTKCREFWEQTNRTENSVGCEHFDTGGAFDDEAVVTYQEGRGNMKNMEEVKICWDSEEKVAFF